MAKTSQDLKFEQVVKVTGAIVRAGCEELHFLVDKDTRNLILMVLEMCLLHQRIGWKTTRISLKLPDDHFSRFWARDNRTIIILARAWALILLRFRNDLVGVFDSWGDHCASRLMSGDLRQRMII